MVKVSNELLIDRLLDWCLERQAVLVSWGGEKERRFRYEDHKGRIQTGEVSRTGSVIETA